MSIKASESIIDLKERLKEVGYEVMRLSNELHDKYGDDKFILNNVWKPLSFYSMDIIEKSNLIDREGKKDQEKSMAVGV